MPEIPRRSVTDLIAMYTYEPSLIDIYVEGSTDKALLEYALKNDQIHIIDINLIDLPARLLDEFGLTPGNRDRVIALTALLDRELDPSISGIRCLIDDDLDRFLHREIVSYRYLIRTDFCCLESYWYGQPQLLKYRKLGLHDKGPLGEVNLITVLDPVIRELFLLRAAAASLGLELAWLDPTGLCTRLGNRIDFDEDEFITRWLNKNSASNQRQVLVERREQLRSVLDDDTRLCMHGKDFVLGARLVCAALRWCEPASASGSGRADARVLHRPRRDRIPRPVRRPKPPCGYRRCFLTGGQSWQAITEQKKQRKRATLTLKRQHSPGWCSNKVQQSHRSALTSTGRYNSLTRQDDRY